MLEHVERPERFLNKIRAVTKPHSYIFVSTCINSPAIDHIFLFRSREEVEALFRNAGLRVVERLELPYARRTAGECEEFHLPVNVAYSLEQGA